MENFFLKIATWLVLFITAFVGLERLTKFQSVMVNVFLVVLIPCLYIVVFAFTDRSVAILTAVFHKNQDS